MRILAVLLLLLSGIVLSFMSVGWAAAFYLWHNIFRPLDFARVQGLLPTAYLVIVMLVVSYVYNAANGKFKPSFHLYFWFVLAYLGWILICALQTFTTPPPYMGLTPVGAWVEIVKYLAPIALVSTCLVTFRDVRLVACALSLSVGIWGGWLGLGGIIHGVNAEMCIPGGQLGERNYFSAAVTGIVPIILYMGRVYDWKYKKPVRIGFYVLAALNCCVIVFANSRGAVVAFLGMIFFFVMLISKSKFKHGFLILASGVLIYSVLPQSLFDRMSTIEIGAEQTEDSAKERTLLMRSAIRGTMENPIFGVGPYCWEHISPAFTGLDKMMQPHCMWLLASAETGLPGLGMILGILFLTLARLVVVGRRKATVEDRQRSGLANTLAASIFGYSIGLTFLNHYYMELFWGMLAVGNCLYALPRRTAPPATRKPAHVSQAQ